MKNLTIKKKLYLLAFGMGSIFIALNSTLFYNAHSVNNVWDQYNKTVKDKMILLSNIKENFGYGGAIHNFKNYIIRGDKKYIILFNKNYSEFKYNKNQYLSIGSLSQVEKKSLKEISKTFEHYQQNLLKAIQLKEKELSILEVDKMIKIDDKKALLAMKNLEEYFDNAIINTTNTIHEKIHTTYNLSFTIIMFLLFLITYLAFFFENTIIKPLRKFEEGLNNFFKFLNKEINEVEPIDLTNNDEFGLMARTTNKNILVASTLHQNMQQTNDELSQLLESFSKNVIASKTNLNSVINYVTDAFVEISGFSREELIGKNHNIVRHPDMKTETFNKMWKTLRNGETWTGEVKNKKKGGGFYWVKAIVTPIFNNKGEIEGYSSVREDITSQKEVENLTKTLEEKVKNRTSDLAQTKQHIQELLDNANQGFMYFDKEMKIGSEYSKETLNILGDDIVDTNIASLLFNNKFLSEDFTEAVIDIFEEEDEDMQEIYISLLPSEVIVDNKYIELKYTILNDNQMMLILTDITNKKELTQKIKDEQQTLKMVVEVVSSLEQFIKIKEDYEELTSHINEFKDINQLNSLAREIHTFKGLFAQKEMLNIVKELHKYEDYIIQSKNNGMLSKQLLEITKGDMNTWLKKDITILKNILGKDIFKNSNVISIDKKRIKKISKLFHSFYNHIKNKVEDEYIIEMKNIENDIKSLKNDNIKLFLNPYKKLVNNLSTKLQKNVNPLIINCDNIYIENKYKPFLNTLIHIFRNSVDHGIESENERFEKEKKQFATILCNVHKYDGHLYLTISDDGRGIDIEKIKQLSLDKEMYTKEQIEVLGEQELLKIIFMDSFSTKDDISDISGRGIGLSSVLAELELLNGTISIINNQNVGIEFKFSIPL